ncbi:uncharacterized protein LOC112892600 [Panicum hallii]|uniref:uncharacterized protein LOC112892600 n=1 Tax=Panicum hallii TaxID=206008 RepID=UPI000DF4E90F|nr:uncharacterized protein LOC112892600 [Panicum hallii]
MTTVDLKELGYQDEPFVLDKDVTQVFYMKDMSSKPKNDKSSKSMKEKSEDDEPKCHIVLAVYGDNVFRRRFRMPKAMFIDICHGVAESNPYFQRTSNAVGLPGFSTIQKVTAAIRMLAYGGSADRLDEYIRMGESTILETVSKFTRTIVEKYGHIYLRQPNAQDIARLLHIAKERDFPRMLGSIDCMHWEWEKCPTALHDQY